MSKKSPYPKKFFDFPDYTSPSQGSNFGNACAPLFVAYNTPSPSSTIRPTTYCTKTTIPILWCLTYIVPVRPIHLVHNTKRQRHLGKYIMYTKFRILLNISCFHISFYLTIYKWNECFMKTGIVFFFSIEKELPRTLCN